MQKKTIKYLLFFLLLNFACSNQNSISTITGTSKDLAGKTVYLKKYNHFNFLDNDYILDSCKVDKNGYFKLQTDETEQLVTISQYNALPPTYQVFKKMPQIYYYSMCLNFLGNEPTLFMEHNSYHIKHWDLANADSSVLFDDATQNHMRQHYRTTNFRDKIANETGKPIELSTKVAWNMVETKKDSLLKEVQHFDASQAYKDYLNTEINLSAINDFFIWYDNQTTNSIDIAFYDSLLNVYNLSNWHQNSVEYLKLTERYLSDKLNNTTSKSPDYYPADSNKMEKAKLYVGENIKQQYLKNLEMLMKE